MPVPSSRYQSPPQAPPIEHGWTWLSWVQHELDAGAITTGITDSNSGRVALWAAYAYRLGEAERSDVFALIDQSTAYWEGATETTIGSTEQARASRCLQLMADTGPLVGAELASAQAWCEAMHPRRDYERGAYNRPLDEGYFLQTCSTVGATDPLDGGLSYDARADLHWGDWFDLGDIAEDSGNYIPFVLSRLTWWSQLRGAPLTKLLALADRWLQLVTPVGPIPHYGDDIGIAGNAGVTMGAFARLAALTGDGRYRWAADRMFDFVASRRAEIEASTWDTQYRRNVMEALMDALLDPAPDPADPSLGTVVTMRRKSRRADFTVAGEYPRPRWMQTADVVPAKLLLRDVEGDTFVCVNLATRGSHSHPEMGAPVSYIHQGSVLLTGTLYDFKGPEDHNQFVVLPEGDDTPQLVHQVGAHSGGFDASGVIDIAFRARRISGSPYLTVRRSFSTIGGDAEICVLLDDDFQDYAVQMELVTGDPQALTFSLATDFGSGVVTGGTFEVQDVVVTQGETELFTWSPGQHTVVSDTFPAQHNNAVTVDPVCFSESLPYAKLNLPQHLQQPADVVRELLIMDGGALLVKDVATITADFTGFVGPRWQGDVAATLTGSTGQWTIECQHELTIDTNDGSTNLVTWTNEARDMVVSVDPAGSTELDDFVVGQVVHYASVMIPHTVGTVAGGNAPDHKWIANTATLTAVRVRDCVAVLNGTGGEVTVEGVTSSAPVFVVSEGSTARRSVRELQPDGSVSVRITVADP